MTDTEKIDFIIKALEGGSLSKFADRIGVFVSTASRIRSGALPLRTRIDAIVSAYPMVNRAWLEGRDDYPGDLTVSLVKERMQSVIDSKDETIKALNAELRRQQKIINKLTKL